MNERENTPIAQNPNVIKRIEPRHIEMLIVCKKGRNFAVSQTGVLNDPEETKVMPEGEEREREERGEKRSGGRRTRIGANGRAIGRDEGWEKKGKGERMG